MTRGPLPGLDARFLALSAKAFNSEEQAVDRLLPLARQVEEDDAAIEKRATGYVKAVRKAGARTGIERFQKEYGLSSREGVMIMCLAEALLRIPDGATADALIHDKLSGGDWDRHMGFGRPWLMRAGALGLEIAGAIGSDGLRESAGEFVGGLIRRLGEPVVRTALKTAMSAMGGAFVIGDTLAAARRQAEKTRGPNMLFSFDMLGEGARSASQADAYFARYLEAIESLKGDMRDPQAHDGVSIKLSALHPRVELKSWPRLQAELLPRLRKLVAAAALRGVPLTVDAEESSRLDVMLLCLKALLASPECKNYAGLGLALQAYHKRAPDVIDWLAELARKENNIIAVRLVKGAYWDAEIKRAQELGLKDYPVYTRKSHTDISYLACAKKLLGAPDCFYPQFATHNARTIAAILEYAPGGRFEFQRLWGMGEKLHEQVMAQTSRRCRVYAPVGAPGHLLSYLIRRILENGANSSFVRGLFDAPLEELLASPLAQAEEGRAIQLPADILPRRKNSQGYELGNASQLTALWPEEAEKIAPPADANASDVDAACRRAAGALKNWRAVEASGRTMILEKAADLFARDEQVLLGLLMREGKKTLADSIAEVREAIDYCRYYAAEARKILAPVMLPSVSGERNTIELEPRGIFVAISPWNFPLAIFTGQVVAALVAGNAVLAKPAEQTPSIAAYAVKLLHEAGIPKDVLQLFCGSGEEVGQALIRHPQCAGVAFTGSTETAWAINRVLAARDAPIAALIAETGGQNCMIVDSSALIEQAVDDIVTSAFGSAGQRCSALRVAFVQENIADELEKVLAGAMKELRVGSPLEAATDIPPVIDKDAYDGLMRHIERMQKEARLIAASVSPDNAQAQLLVAPRAFEIPSLSMLTREVFGPVLHVVRWREGGLDDVIAQINATGYGLTFGIHSRIDERIREVCAKMNAGNIYVNRSMIGASVGMQPFGGHGLSGTGPKAGGPHYLARFCRERTVCINTAAVGGNLELLV